MPLLIVRNERTIGDLRARLVGRRGAGELPDRLVARIREENRHVDLDNLRPGVVLTIPDDDEDVHVREDATATELLAEGIEAMIAAVSDVVASAGERAAQQAKDEAVDRAAVRRSLDLKAVKEAARKDKELQANLTAVKEALASADRAADKAAEIREQALSAWTDDLAAIRSLRG